MASSRASADGPASSGIRKLGAAAVARIRSTANIPGIPQIVEELVANSIDAGARKIAVRFDIEKFWVEVSDDGCGISPGDLHKVGARYHTSKHQAGGGSLQGLGYGFKGEAVSSMRDIAQVRVTTRLRPAGSLTYTRALSPPQRAANTGSGVTGDAAAPGSAVAPAATQRPQPGTTVEVRDIFGSLPVRRMRLSAAQYEAVRLRVQCFALAHPRTAFSLHNCGTNRTLVNTAPGLSADAGTVFEALFGRDKAGDLLPVDFTHGAFHVSGFASQGRHHNRSLQFMFVNQRAVFRTRLHKAINSAFAASAADMFAGAARAGRGAGGAPLPSSGLPSASSSACSPTRGSGGRDDGYVWVLDLRCAKAAYDLCPDATKTHLEFHDWDNALLAVAAAIKNTVAAGGAPACTSSANVVASGAFGAGNAGGPPGPALPGGRSASVNGSSARVGSTPWSTPGRPKARTGTPHSTPGPGRLSLRSPVTAAMAAASPLGSTGTTRSTGKNRVRRGRGLTATNTAMNPPSAGKHKRRAAGPGGAGAVAMSASPEQAKRLNLLGAFHYTAQRNGALSSHVSRAVADGDNKNSSAVAARAASSSRTADDAGTAHHGNPAKRARHASTPRDEHTASATTTVVLAAEREAGARSAPQHGTRRGPQALRQDGNPLPHAAAFPVDDGGASGDGDGSGGVVNALIGPAAAALLAGSCSDGHHHGHDHDHGHSHIFYKHSLGGGGGGGGGGGSGQGFGLDLELHQRDAAGVDVDDTHIKWRGGVVPLSQTADGGDGGGGSGNYAGSSSADNVGADGDGGVTDQALALVADATDNALSAVDGWLSTATGNAAPGVGALNIIRSTARMPTKLTKGMIPHLRVLDQVDNKFVACIYHRNRFPGSTVTRTPAGMGMAEAAAAAAAARHGDGGPASEAMGRVDTDQGGDDSPVHVGLYIIDQHAAHERIRLEKLIAEHCTPLLTDRVGRGGSFGARLFKVVRRNPPMQLAVSAADHDLIVMYRDRVAQLGFEFATVDAAADLTANHGQGTAGSGPAADRAGGSYFAVAASIIPAAVQFSSAAVVARVLKAQLATAKTGSPSRPLTGPFSTVPMPMLEVLASCACHGAIKFGDPLTKQQCTQLVADLAECTYPFQCAHGRPSIIPLLDMPQQQ